MSRFDSRPSFEAAIARLHFINIITALGQGASGTYIVTVPGETTEAEKWLRPALAYIQAIHHVSEIEEAVDGMKPQAAYDAALLTSDGIYTGHTGARCTLYLTEAGHEDLHHPSVRLADDVIEIELDPDLVVQAAAEMGRIISADDAKLLIAMPWRHRRLALLSPRPVSESYDLHLLALEAEAAAKVVGDLKKAEKDGKKDKAPKRIVPTSARSKTFTATETPSLGVWNSHVTSTTGVVVTLSGLTLITEFCFRAPRGAARPRMPRPSRKASTLILCRAATPRGWEPVTAIRVT